MKKLFLCLLAVMMLVSAATVSAVEPVEKSNAVNEFLKETDFEKQDIALQVQEGDKISDLVIRIDGDNIHLLTRNGDTVQGHLQLNPTGIYDGSGEALTLLRFSTINAIAEEFGKGVGELIADILNLPEYSEDNLPTEAEVMQALSDMVDAAAKAKAQEEADAIVLQAAGKAFARKLKSEYILDVKEDDASAEISLRSEALATALGEAMDELMSNPDLAEVMERRASKDGEPSFAEARLNWMAHREEILDAIRTIENSNKIDENGHLQSHFQIGEEGSAVKVLEFDADVYIDAEYGELEARATLGFKDEDPIIVYELEQDQNFYWEQLSALEDSKVEITLELDEDKVIKSRVNTVIEGKEYLQEEIGPDYLYLKGENGGISTSVRETWTGKTRYELFAEFADGKDITITADFYEDFDSLVCEVYTDESDDSLKLMLSRIDKLAIDDLSAAKDIKDITVENVNDEIEKAVKPVVDFLGQFVEAPNAETEPAK